MLLSDQPIAARLILAGLLVATIGLSGCGRRGPLEPPPGAAVAAPASVAPVTGANAKPAAAESYGSPPPPAEPPRSEKRFLLDFLL